MSLMAIGEERAIRFSALLRESGPVDGYLSDVADADKTDSACHL